MRVGFVGASHLGQVYSAATAAAGFEVTLIDPSESLISALREAPSVAEPGLDDAWMKTPDKRTCSTDLQASRDCDLVFLSMDVPLTTMAKAAQKSLKPSPVTCLSY